MPTIPKARVTSTKENPERDLDEEGFSEFITKLFEGIAIEFIRIAGENDVAVRSD
jgi:hypothetical protein